MLGRQKLLIAPKCGCHDILLRIGSFFYSWWCICWRLIFLIIIVVESTLAEKLLILLTIVFFWSIIHLIFLIISKFIVQRFKIIGWIRCDTMWLLIEHIFHGYWWLFDIFISFFLFIWHKFIFQLFWNFYTRVLIVFFCL